MQRLFHRLYNSIQKRFFKTAQDRIFDRWFAAKGDLTHRLNYDLNRSSVVVDLGGYRGDWAAQIHSRYGCRIVIFEPVPAFADQIRARFREKSEVEVFAFGLGAREETSVIQLGDDASSQFSSGRSSRLTKGRQEIQIQEFARFFATHGIDSIDLLKVNIEGAEYALLEHILASGWAPKIRDLQIQFHDFFADARDRRERLRSGLKATHQTTYDYPFVWENWRRVDSNTPSPD